MYKISLILVGRKTSHPAPCFYIDARYFENEPSPFLLITIMYPHATMTISFAFICVDYLNFINISDREDKLLPGFI